MQQESEIFTSAREAMVEQLRRYGIHDPRVLESMATVPRQLFVPDALRARAYEDRPLPIGQGQTISQPYIVAFMLEAMQLKPGDRVLDVGTGSGYQAAILAKLCREVWSVEIVAELSRSAARVLTELEASNVHVVLGDGSVGLPEHGPYDAIVVAAGAPEPSPALLAQLRTGGRLVIPVGDLEQQVLRRYTKEADAMVVAELLPCRFVPLVGMAGWRDERRASQNDFADLF